MDFSTWAGSTVTSIVKHLEENYETIRDEYMSAVMGMGRTTDMSSSKPQVSKPLAPDYDMNKKGAEHASGKLHLGNWDWHSSYVLNGEVKPKFESLFYGNMSDSHNPFGFKFFRLCVGRAIL